MASLTRVIRVDAEDPDLDALVEPAHRLREGSLVAFPTETVYGLGADALDETAVRRLFRAKGRPADNPLIVHVADRGGVSAVAREVPEVAERLISAFWPGPLTLVLPRRVAVPDVTTASLDSVAVRCPAHPVAAALLRAAGVPVAAPSANRSGHPSATRAEHVLADLDGRIDVVVDGGPCTLGVESTVVDVRQDPVRVLRLGGVSIAPLEAVVGVVEVDPHAHGKVASAGAAVASPGMRHRHYAPEAHLEPVEGANRIDRLRQLWEAHTSGIGVGFLVTDEMAREAGMSGDDVVSLGDSSDPEAMARGLYATLRALDTQGFRLVYVEIPPGGGLLDAVADRLRRASHHG